MSFVHEDCMSLRMTCVSIWSIEKKNENKIQTIIGVQRLSISHVFDDFSF